jgi:uncharacterized protein (UPF0216 family)
MAKEKRDIGLIQVKLRMPIALHRKLMREADKRGQTLNAEILSRLTESDRAMRVAEDVLTLARNALAQARRIEEAATKTFKVSSTQPSGKTDEETSTR